MLPAGIPFKDVLDAACKSVPRLWTPDGKLNLTAVARYCEDHGYPVSQPTLHRHYHATTARPARALNHKTIAALSAAFRVPARLWRGEPLEPEMERALERFTLADLFLAEKISRLPDKTRANILERIEETLEREEQLKRAYQQGNVTPIDRHKR